MRETARHRHAFDRYFRLGSDRTITQLRAALGAEGDAPALRTLWEWSRQLQWQQRLVDLERQARDAEDAARVAAIREMHERQAKEGLLLQQKGTAWLTELSAAEASAEAAIRAVTEGAKLERLARGEATERTEHQGPSDPRLEELHDAELDRLIELAERPLAGEESPQP